MGLSIKNDEVERMIRELAARRGVPMTEALRQLLAEERARSLATREAQVAEKRRRLMQVIARTSSLPRLSDLSDEEIIGYDENGLPR
jgi:antitoxin VapB